jgi:ATP-binding cassette, subfamily F, member 1
MTVSEKHNAAYISETLSPFLLDTEYCTNPQDIEKICRQLVIAFGGSGYKPAAGSVSHSSAIPSHGDEDDLPQLLSAPMKIKEMAGLDQVKQTYGGVVMIDSNHPQDVSTNEELDIRDVPINQRSKRKVKRENEQLARRLRIESALAAEQRQQMAAARMAAIKASRNASKSKAVTGLHLENFSLPHPSGTGDLFSEISLNLNYGSRYGLIGRNGAGKTTLMKALATYRLPGLDHLKILLVDQHVEGDEETPLQWVLRADVERTALLADEEKLTALIIQAAMEPETSSSSQAVPAVDLPEELIGVNLEVALQEVYERMEAIGVRTAEGRAIKILTGLGFDREVMSSTPTQALSGGWAMRAALAAALFVKPDLLLLDEVLSRSLSSRFL